MKCEKCGTPMITDRCIVCEAKERVIDFTLVCPDCGRNYTPETQGQTMCADCQAKRKSHDYKFLVALPPAFQGVTKDHAYPFVNGIVHGGYGVGKTWRAYATAYKLGVPFLLKTELGCMNFLRLGFTVGDFEKRENRLKTVPFLIVDEFGKCPATDFNRFQMFEILNHRYDWQLPTLLICQGSREDARKTIPADVADRFRENVYEVEGRSMRWKKD